jgi:hypothetical protein
MPEADHASLDIVAEAVRLPGDATVLSISAPAKPPVEVLFVNSSVPVLLFGLDDPALAVSTTMTSFASPVVKVRPGEVPLDAAISVTPKVAGGYSTSLSMYSVLEEKVGVIVANAGQFKHTAISETVPVPFCCVAYGTKKELVPLPTIFVKCEVVVLHDSPTTTVFPAVVVVPKVQAVPVVAEL